MIHHRLSRPLLVVLVPPGAAWPRLGLLRAVAATARRCDAAAAVRVRRAARNWRGPDVLLLGEWGCSPGAVHASLALLYSELDDHG